MPTATQYAEAIWSYVPRTLQSGSAGAPTTIPEEYAQAIWAYSTRSVTAAARPPFGRRVVRFQGPTGDPFTLNRSSPQAVGLMSWWPTLASRGTNALRDLGPLKRNASLGSGALLSLSSERGWCLELDGVDDQVSAGNLTEYHGLTAFSITAWVRPADVTTTGVFRAILSKRNLVDTNRAVFLFDKDSTNPDELRFGINIAGSWLQWTTSNLNLTAGVYQLVGVSYDTTNGPTFFKNGLPVSSSQTSGATKPPLSSNNAPVVIGGVETYGAVEKPWLGGIDDPRTYSRALSAAEHWQLYDPATRWDLYQPLRRRAVILPYALDTGGGSALTVTLSELLSLTEAKAFGASKGLTESVPLTDARSLGIARNLPEVLTLTDVRALGIARVLSESLALTDTRRFGLERRLSEALSLTDSVSASLFLGLALTLNLSEALTYTESLARGIGKGLAESWALTDSGSRGLGKKLSESIPLSDAQALGIARVLAEALNLTDTRSLGQVLRLAESLSLSDALIALLGHSLAVTLTETLSLADQAALVAALFRAVIQYVATLEYSPVPFAELLTSVRPVATFEENDA